MKSGDNRITIELPKGLKLVAERNIDPEYQNEIYVGIETPDPCASCVPTFRAASSDTRSLMKSHWF